MKRQEETRAGGRHCPWGGHRNPEPSTGREKTEADLAHREACDIESGDRLDKAHRVLPAPADRAHVRDIKETGLLADLRVNGFSYLSALAVKGTRGSQQGLQCSVWASGKRGAMPAWCSQ